MKKSKINFVACFGIYISLLEERDNWKKECRLNPTTANQTKLSEALEQLNQMHSIVANELNSPTWN
jgi:hypothetical protein